MHELPVSQAVAEPSVRKRSDSSGAGAVVWHTGHGRGDRARATAGLHAPRGERVARHAGQSARRAVHKRAVRIASAHHHVRGRRDARAVVTLRTQAAAIPRRADAVARILRGGRLIPRRVHTRTVAAAIRAQHALAHAAIIAALARRDEPVPSRAPGAVAGLRRCNSVYLARAVRSAGGGGARRAYRRPRANAVDVGHADHRSGQRPVRARRV